ncbi:MATE family efflux transporter [Parvularcula maris]|uniref:MATE family efflux transporter n=1 Tax=Parvularcula maris TaxID=2965077 RepID=A0A9X2L938_9PROT|nr:MATE family efflux transporter [Parvularcula maris]MCQ8184522.1 MATE family efflux transporter [Parvularcula maris]
MAAIITPLLGLIDVAVLARAAETEALAGASLAGAVFSLLYWSFGFLRMSLSGLSAQALGEDNEARLRRYLLQGLLIGAGAGLLLLLLGIPIQAAARLVLVEGSEASPGAAAAMDTYIGIRLLAAPFAVATTAILGWLTGQGRTRLLMLVTSAIALINAGLSVLFVLGLGYGIAGLAAATALAETAGFLIGLACVAHVAGSRGGWRSGWPLASIREGIGVVLGLNRDIFLRTVLLDIVFLSFARFGAELGDLTLAANHVLLNLVLTATLLLDGPAIAAETFVGQAAGASGDRSRLFASAWRSALAPAVLLALTLCAVLIVFGQPLLTLTIGDQAGGAEVLSEARRFLPWLALMPVTVAGAYYLDGVFIGATRGRDLRNTMAVSTLFFLGTALHLTDRFGNHGLWAALLLFMLVRTAALLTRWPSLAAQITAPRDVKAG